MARSAFRLPDLKRVLNAAAGAGFNVELDPATGRVLFSKSAATQSGVQRLATDTPPDVLAELEAKLGRG
jgi:hypothetical protein